MDGAAIGPGTTAPGADGPADERTARLLRLIGLGVRARGAVVGVDRVREAAGRRTLCLAVVAPDASPNSLHKIEPMLRAARIPVIAGPSAAVLGRAVGRETTAVVGVVDANLARGIQATQAGPQDQGVEGGATRATGDGRPGTGSGHRPRSGPVRRNSRRMD